MRRLPQTIEQLNSYTIDERRANDRFLILSLLFIFVAFCFMVG